MFFLSDLSTFKKQKEKRKPNYISGLGYAAGAGYIGQQTLRSGIPRALGVRLESHSTSRKNAKTILDNGGYLDPNKSGSGAIRALEGSQGIGDTTDINAAKGKIYITGIHKDAMARDLPNPFGGTIKVDPKSENPIQQVINRVDQRRGYRGQSTIDWDDVNRDKNKIDNLLSKRDAWMKKTNDPGKNILGQMTFPDQQTANEYQKLSEQTNQRLNKARLKALVKAQLPWTGRSLYVGGSDKYFDKNFKPDFDDPRAMYTDKKLKVYGSRFGATKAALKKYGNGNYIKGAVKLMSANKGRVAAGLGILGAGTIYTGYLANKAKQAFTGDSRVKGHTRRSKSGKLTNVRSFVKKRDNKSN
jgi:hypothetical protein